MSLLRLYFIQVIVPFQGKGLSGKYEHIYKMSLSASPPATSGVYPSINYHLVLAHCYVIVMSRYALMQITRFSSPWLCHVTKCSCVQKGE